MADILLVEDCSSLAQIISMSLKQAGFGIEKAKTGEAAIHAAQKKHFDLVLCDTDISDTDSIQLIRKLCQLSGKEHSGLIAFANAKNANRKQDALRAGADRWIVKPFDVDELVIDVLTVMH